MYKFLWGESLPYLLTIPEKLKDNQSTRLPYNGIPSPLPNTASESQFPFPVKWQVP